MLSLPKAFILSLFALSIYSCSTENKETTGNIDTAELEKNRKSDPPSFSLINSSESGITFKNSINELDPNFNFFLYNQIYMGAGVAVADFDNDGLTDIMFQSSRGVPELYQNKGNFAFEKKPLKAQLMNLEAMGTGISAADVNADGLVDIYMCYAGPTQLSKEKKGNRLLINKGNFTFEEASASFGLTDLNNSIQASWFDYDRDGDLDMYLVNTVSDLSLSGQIIKREEIESKPQLVDNYGGQDRLFRNNGNNTFTDVTKSAGIVADVYNGFNATIGDYNQDMYPDIYVTNDFVGPDLLYINQKNGTFKEQANTYMRHTSYFSMGCDATDLNNDGFDDIISLDMAPEDYIRSRRTMSMTDPEYFQRMVDNQYNNQYMHNMLHLNSGMQSFSEVAQFAGIEKTDWSWAVLAEDMNDDGYRDLFVTNGIYRDIIDKDVTELIKGKIKGIKTAEDLANLLKPLLDEFTSEAIANYAFINTGQTTFENKAELAGMGTKSFSTGAAFADFDNDGDLDLVVNNVLQDAFLYRNTANAANAINISLEGNTQNKLGVGTKVCIETNNGKQCHTAHVSRGVMSSMEPKIHFGLGSATAISKITALWPTGEITNLDNPKLSKSLTIKQKDASKGGQFYQAPSNTLLAAAKHPLDAFVHQENAYNDLKTQILLPHKLSTLGPALASADINSDGVEEVFLGGATGQASQLFLSNGSNYTSSTVGENAKEYVAAAFADINGDGVKDLLATSGSYEFETTSKLQSLDVFLLDKAGNISAAKTYPLTANVASIATGDMDGDGDIDVVLGGRVIKDEYPKPTKSYLLINEAGNLVDKTADLAPELSSLGMVSSVVLANVDADADLEVVAVGEWMSVTILDRQADGSYKIGEKLQGTSGWWNVVKAADIDQDGDLDLICGNLGLNYKFDASPTKPFHSYSLDFDNNGTYDIVLAKHKDDKFLPIRGKVCSSEQMPFVGEKFASFKSYAEADLDDIYGDKLSEALHLTVETFEHQVFLNDGSGNFTAKPLPLLTQQSPIYDLVVTDINGDGNMDILAVGNQYGSEVETTRADSGNGSVLLGAGNGEFTALTPFESGLLAHTHARKLTLLNDGTLIIANNGEAVTTFKIK